MTSENIEGQVYIGTGETEAIDIIAKCIKNIQNKHKNIFFNISRTMDKMFLIILIMV